MKCRRCEHMICFLKPPFGAYFCKNEHVQCAECDLLTKFCVICGEGTKYKSPHFIDERSTDPKELERAKLQIPIIRDIIPEKEDQEEFQKLRHECTTNDKTKLLLGFKPCDDVVELNAVRTLSAIVTKNLYSSHDSEQHNRIDEVAESSSHELRLQRIIRTLRETTFSVNTNTNTNNNNNDENEKDIKQQQVHEDAKIKREESEQATTTKKAFEQRENTTNLLTPTHSKLEAACKKFSTKINLKIKTSKGDSDDDGDDGGEVSENKSVAGAEANDDNNNNKTLFKLPNCPNFKSLFCPHLISKKLVGFPISIEGTNLDRRPFSCPLGRCGCRIFISELNNHIVLDHPTLALTHIKVGQFREFAIDITSCENNFAPQSVVCFLLKNVVVNFGSSPLKDLLPLFLMVGRYSMCNVLDKPKMVSSDTACVTPWSSSDCFLIWLAGVIPERCELTAAISVFSPENLTLSRWYVDRVNTIQVIKDVESIFNSCERLILTYPEIKLLTNDFKDMLLCQVGIIGCELKEF